MYQKIHYKMLIKTIKNVLLISKKNQKQNKIKNSI